MNENKLKHLELIQNVINRMAANSFLLKGWTVTLVSSIFVLSQKDSNSAYVIVALLPIIGFWILDSYFIKQERLFRKLYDQVRVTDINEIDFSMNTSNFNLSIKYCSFSKTFITFYGSILIAVIVILLIGNFEKLRLFWVCISPS